MYESIKSFSKQLLYKLEIINGENLKQADSFVVVGMGGSALAPLLLKTWKKDLDITIHRDYDLPLSVDKLKNKLIILSSYSGDTEEVISAFHKAKENNLNIAVISIGGELLSLAKENGIPFIELPDLGIQPRMALGLSLKAFLKFLGEEDALKDLEALGNVFDVNLYENEGKKLASEIRDCVPVVYASTTNTSLAYIWKIKLNETGKTPAFYNVLPELNHNEMTSFDINKNTEKLSKNFSFLIFKDEEDSEKLKKRIEILEKLYSDRKLKVKIIELREKNIWLKIFSTLILADFTAYYLAKEYGLESEQVPMVEEFKKLIK